MSKFMDESRAHELWNKIKQHLGNKQDKLSGELNQVVGFSQDGIAVPQYLNISHLSDGNPVGTVISFMGVNAPKGYLICDGSSYKISAYPELSDFFKQQFGNERYFGGDKESETFAVPDMRNLFLRGYHGESGETLSGDIGKKQEATTFPSLGIASNTISIPRNNYLGEYRNYDTAGIIRSDTIYYTLPNTGSMDIPTNPTSRPVNMAVLYCIKAV